MNSLSNAIINYSNGYQPYDQYYTCEKWIGNGSHILRTVQPLKH